MVVGLKQKAAKGAVWAMLERIVGQIVGFGVSMILARLLSPSDYGTVALLTIFLSIAGILAESGLGSALIQKKDATDLDFNSVFYLSVFASSVAYFLLFCAAGPIARFYGMPELKLILRISALTIVFYAINSVQNAELRRRLLFDLSFRVSLASQMASAVIGLTLAFCGFGVWALVWQGFTGALAGTIMRWLVIAWRPKLMFSISSLRGLFSFGWKLTVSSLIETAYSNLYGVIIGKLYSRADLAYVNKGQQHPNILMNAIMGTICSVAFPVLSQLQDDKNRLRDAMRKMMRCSSFLVFPLVMGLAVCARPTMLILFGEQWMPAVPYVQLCCFSFSLYPFHLINLQAIQALGRSDIYLKLEILKKVVGIIAILLSYRHGVFCLMAVMAFVGGPLSVLINAFPSRVLLGYPFWLQVKDVCQPLVLTTLMGGVVYSVDVISLCLIPQLDCSVGAALILAVQVVVGIGFYFLLSCALKVRAMGECMSLFPDRIKCKVPVLFGWLESQVKVQG